MKYKEGDFGYWWTVTEGNDDIEGEVYDGDIDCSFEKISSLKGCPDTVVGAFDCSNNKLTTLKYSPEIVSNLYVSYNQLSSLQYIPYSKTSINCSVNPLSKPDSLVGLQDIVEHVLNLTNCELISTKGLSTKIKADLELAYNNLIQFEDKNISVDRLLDISNNHFESSKTIPVCGGLICTNNSNKYIKMEYDLRNTYPNLSEVEIQNEMFKKTKDRIYLSKETNSLFM